MRPRSSKGIEALKRSQSAYLSTLAGGSYGTEYFRERARIGKIHDLLDMPMKHYLGQYGVYYDLILPLVGERLVESLTESLRGLATDGGAAVGPGGDTDDAEPASPGLPPELEATVEREVSDAVEDLLSILRIINLDMQVVTDTYINSYSERLEAGITRNKQLMSEVESDIQQPMGDLRSASEDISESATEISEAACWTPITPERYALGAIETLSEPFDSASAPVAGDGPSGTLTAGALSDIPVIQYLSTILAMN